MNHPSSRLNHTSFNNLDDDKYSSFSRVSYSSAKKFVNEDD